MAGATTDTTLAELIAPLAVDDVIGSSHRLAEIDDESVQIRLESAGEEDFVIELSPLDDNAPRFASTRSFNISYRGNNALTSDTEVVLRAIIAAVERNDVGLQLRKTGSNKNVDEALSTGRSRVLGAKEVEDFYLVHYEYEESAETGTPLPTSRLGILYRCNQDCVFCQLAYMNVDLPREKIFAAIDESRERGSMRLIITGGEPTLSKNLFDYIEYARKIGFEVVELQTNAVAAHSPRFADKLVAAGLTNAQVSLHGPDGEISDRLTAAPGTHAKTLDGVSNLLDRGVAVLINHLIFADNSTLLPDFADLVEQRWSDHKDSLVIQFHAPLNEFDRVEDARQHIARFSDYAEPLLATWDRLHDQGFLVHDLQDPTGLPALCLLGANERYLGPIARQEVRPRIHKWETGWMTHVDACSACELREYCIGIPRHYLDLHGDSEFQAVKLSDIR